MKNLNLTPVYLSLLGMVLLLVFSTQTFAQKCPEITEVVITPAEICEGGTISVCVNFSSSPNNVVLEGVDEERDGTALCFDTVVAYPDDIDPPCEPVELSSAVTFTAVCEGAVIEAPSTVATFIVYPSPSNFLPTVSFEACNTEPIVTPGICPVEIALSNVVEPVVDCSASIDGSADWEVLLPFTYPDCFIPPSGSAIIPACLEPCICPEIIGIGGSDIAFCDGESVEICVNFNKALDARTIVDINGIIQDGAAGAASICALIPLENATCDPLLVDIIIDATCDGELIDNPFTVLPIRVFPPADLFIPEITPGIACETAPIVLAGTCGTVSTEILIPADNSCGAIVDGLLSWTIEPSFDNYPDCFVLPTGEVALPACEVCCPSEAIAEPTVEAVCGDALPTLPTDADLGMDDLTNTIVTWLPDPTELIIASCVPQEIIYTPTITCSADETVLIVGAIHTLTVYPDPASYLLSDPMPAACGEIPVLVNTGACDLVISEPAIEAPIDACTEQGTPPVSGSYTFTITDPYTGFTPCERIIEPIIIPVAGCEVCIEPCPTEATAAPSIEVLCGNATPNLPTDTELGIDELTNAIITWFPDPTEQVAVACEPVTIEYIPTITCSTDPTISITGPSHTFTLYPDATSYTLKEVPPATCGEVPSLVNMGTCPLIISEPIIVPPVDGCTSEGTAPLPGTYTFTASDPYAGLSPCVVNYTPVVVPVAGCEICENCPNEVNGTPIVEAVCGDALPKLPPDEALGIDDPTNTVITWSPDPSIMITATCEVQTVEYTPFIACTNNSDVVIAGPTYTLKVYPEPSVYALNISEAAACGEVPTVSNIGTCDLLISDPIIVEPSDGCTADGTPPIVGAYTFNILDPYAPYTPCDYEVAPIVIPVAACEVCIEHCPSEAQANPTSETVCGNATPTLPNANALGIDHITNAVVSWSPDPFEPVVVACEPVTVEYIPTITCISDPSQSFTGPSHTLTLYPDANAYELQGSGDVGCGETPSLVNIGTCDLIISEPVIIAPVDGCAAEGVPTSPGSYTFNITDPYGEHSPCSINMAPLVMRVNACENCKGCPTAATAAPIIDRVCGSALPNLPSDNELGIDIIDNAVVTWNLNPLQPIIATCELQVIAYIPTITCATNSDVSFTGPTYTLKVYPDPDNYQLNNPTTAACGEVPALINLGVCNLDISAPAIVQPQDGCLAANIPFITGSYTYQVSDPYAGESPCFLSFDPIVIAANACEDCSNICDLSVPSISSSSPSCGVNDGSITITASGGTGTYQYSIDGGNIWLSSNHFTGLPAGNYTIAVRNSDGTCVHIDGAITLHTTPPPVIANVGTTNPKCEAQDGMIVITASSGTGSYQYSIDGGNTWQTASTFTGLSTGNYAVAVRNADGSCAVVGQLVQLTASYLQISNVSLQHPSCEQTNGNIVISASGGNGSYEYSIDGGANWQSTNIFNNLSAGTYTIFIRNNDGTCVTGGMTRTLIGGTSPQVNDVNVQNPSTCGVNNGSISISGTGGSGSYQYSIDDGNTWQSANTFTGLAGGNYPLAIRNADGTCTSFWETVILSAPGGPTVADIQVNAASDCNAGDGQITVITGGGSGFEYTSDGGATWQSAATFTGLSTGTYYVAVRNIGGACETSLTTAVFVGPTPPVITSVVATASNCENNGGTISIAATGGLGDYQYSIDGGSTWQATNTFGFLAAGVYAIRVRNSNGSCIISEQAIVNEAVGCNQCMTPNGLDLHCVQIVQSNNSTCCQIWGTNCQEAYNLCNGGANQTATVGQYVWIDQDGDGIYDANEPAISGIEVSLYDNNGILVGILFTDNNGQFLFSDVAPGNYYITFELPTGYSFTLQDMGSNEFTDSDVNPFNGTTNSFTVFPNDVNLTIGAGLVEDSACSIPFNIETEQICQNGLVGTYDLLIQVTGGVAPYSVSGVFNGILVEGQIETVRLTDGEGFDFLVTDANGCSQSVSSDDLIPCSKLVVDLLDFNGEATDAGNELSWTTASETNNAYFTLYASKDGINFEEIAQINGQGTQYDLQHYTFVDKNAPTGITYYYLSQTDWDGTSNTISEVIALQRGESSFGWIRISPMPATDLVTLHYTSDEATDIQIQLYNLIGQVVYEKTVPAGQGIQIHRLPVYELPAGVYIVLLNNGHEQVSGKVIKE